MTQLTFPEPAADLLARSHEILDRHLTPHTPSESGWAIGGGSALAARWKHRWSKDLDIIVGIETEFARLTEAENPCLWREMRAAGATTIESEGTLRFKFGERQIEILGDELTPGTGQERIELACGDAVVRATMLSTAQILYSKLHHRGFGAPVRDLYDMAVAYQRARDALATAVNAQPERLVRTAAWTWDAQNDDYRKDAKAELRDVPAEYKHIQENPGTHAATAVTESRYRFMTIEVAPPAIVAWYGSEKFERQAVYTTSAEALERFEADGLNAALKARGWNPRRILEEATAALEDGQALTITPIAGSIQRRRPDRACAPARNASENPDKEQRKR